MIIDFIICCISYYLAFVLRLEWNFIFTNYFNVFLKTIPFVFAIKIIFFYFYELHRDIWEYASIENLLSIIKATSLSSLSIIFVIFTINIKNYPRSVIFIDWALTILLTGGARLIVREFKRQKRKVSSIKKRMLIVGAGDAGVALLKEIKNNPEIKYTPVGFCDDDKTKIGKKIDNLPVLGSCDKIPKLVHTLGVQEIIIAIPSLSGEGMRRIVSKCKEANVKFKTLPSISDIINEKISISQMKDVDVSDFLRRKPIKLNTDLISSHIYNKKVLVSGAAGSIGHELCTQIAKFYPSELILIDMAETPLYWAEFNLRRKFNNLNIVSFLADIKDYDKIKSIIEDKTPDIIYHAAAYKHVPILENNIREAIKNNILGTKTIVDIAVLFEVDEFVMVSTDKAVNPISVMGITKKINEIYVQSVSNKNCKTKFVTVRFGNVLDSSGSVLPLFKKQLELNMPITITHPEAKRFFMTHSEAAQLIIQAGAIGKGGEIFVLKMGDQIKIIDLLNDLLSFYRIPQDKVEIKFIGLRKGEKLEEELIGDDEQISLTPDENILLITNKNSLSYEWINSQIMELEKEIYSNNSKNIDSWLINKCKFIIENASRR